MQVLKILIVANCVTDLGASEHVERSARKVDDRCRGDADFRSNKRALRVVFRNRHGTTRFVEQAHLPQRRIIGTCRIEGVDAVVLGGDKKNVVLALARNIDCRKEERLREDRTVDFEGAQLAELFLVDVLGSENLFR